MHSRLTDLGIAAIPFGLGLPGLYDIGIIVAIYSAVAYGTRAARLAAVAGGTAGAAAAD